MARDKRHYHVFDIDSLIPGLKLKIEHSVSLKDSAIDISDLIPLRTAELERRRAESVGFEKALYNQVLAVVEKWEEQAALTALLDEAIKYIKAPQCQHSSNQWEETERGYHTISNMTYKMSWSVYEDTKYDHALGKSVPAAWLVTWELYTNPPATSKLGSDKEKIAGQDKKRFTDKAAMEKYLNGRIAAYSHLFTEISPPVPKEYARGFTFGGLLLPGYTHADGDFKQADRAAPDEKPSVLGQIAEAREQQRRAKDDARDSPAPEKKKRNGPEL